MAGDGDDFKPWLSFYSFDGLAISLSQMITFFLLFVCYLFVFHLQTNFIDVTMAPGLQLPCCKSKAEGLASEIAASSDHLRNRAQANAVSWNTSEGIDEWSWAATGPWKKKSSTEKVVCRSPHGSPSCPLHCRSHDLFRWQAMPQGFVGIVLLKSLMLKIPAEVIYYLSERKWVQIWLGT